MDGAQENRRLFVVPVMQNAADGVQVAVRQLVGKEIAVLRRDAIRQPAAVDIFARDGSDARQSNTTACMCE